ncbi:granulocyte-macrophage colony-stimulating factor receptor subunit alpha-like [Eudromia elegans]
MPGTAIKNFSCVIYNISLMNCTWSVGRDAPGDTQYFLYWENSREEEENQCELYVKDKNGRHIGCQFQNVTITDNKITYFIVNGSSKVSPIRFYDEYISLYKIGNEEVISPSILALAITAVATLLVAILTVLFCKRTGFWKAAFPQIPEPKSTFQVLPDTTTETEYKMQSITAEPEEIILAAELVK